MLKDTVYLFAIEYVIAGFYPATSSLEENSRRCGCGERESVTGSVTVSGVQGQSRWCRGQETKPAEAENYNDHFYSTQECQTILSLDRQERRQINTYK